MQPVLGMLDQVLGTLSSQLESRVFVSCCRGLWDFTAREVYEYVASLQQGKEHRDAWRGKQSATGVLEVVDTFFKQVGFSVISVVSVHVDVDITTMGCLHIQGVRAGDQPGAGEQRVGQGPGRALPRRQVPQASCGQHRPDQHGVYSLLKSVILSRVLRSV